LHWRRVRSVVHAHSARTRARRHIACMGARKDIIGRET
jgi:hypothetical protein